MTTGNKIDAINKSKLFGKIIEMGCGVAISNLFLNFEGASATIDEIKAPYSKESQEALYHKHADIRSVSKEFIYSVLETESLNDKVNFVMAASFQMQGENDERTLTHGYIGINANNIKRIYHVSIPEHLTRFENFEIIGQIGIDILYDFATNTETLASKHIDQVWIPDTDIDMFDKEPKVFHPDIYGTLDILTRASANGDNFIVITPDKQFIRMEDFMRNKPGTILLKGSFNPIHKYHVLMMEDAKKLYPDYAAAFFCSIKRFDKPDINLIDMEEKINTITGLGYHIIVNTNLYFSGCAAWIKQRWKVPVIFPIGFDTLNRWVDAETEATMEFQEEVLVMEMPKPFKNKNVRKTKEELMQEKPMLMGWMMEYVKFIVFARQGYQLSENAKYFQRYFEVITPSAPDDGISSTKIRAGLLKTGL